jgi:metallo-beta-lactamase family protein
MRVEFHGAAREVTGSCTLLEAGGTRVLVDCGLFQGQDAAGGRNRAPFPFDVGSLDAVVMTHAHIDHVGRVPALARAGLRGPVVATRATGELATLMLLDAAKIQEEEHERHHGPPPTYGVEDVEQIRRSLQPLRYDEPLRIGSIELRLQDAGHILGSAHVLATLTEDGRTVRYVASGDVGPRGRAIVGDPHPFRTADAVQVESTYGDRDHPSLDRSLSALLEILESVEGTDGVVVVPAFALGRTQDILWHLNAWKRAGRLKRLSVYVDSPLSDRLTRVFRANPAIWDEAARERYREGDDPFDFPGLRVVSDWRESENVTYEAKGALIIAASGMCQSGRVVNHLQTLLPRKTTHVVLVGYQGSGTLGRRLADGDQVVVIRGFEVPVFATIHTLGGFSAHAGKTELLEWLRASDPPPKRVFLVHGEPDVQESFAQTVRDALGSEVLIPDHGQSFDL